SGSSVERLMCRICPSPCSSGQRLMPQTGQRRPARLALKVPVGDAGSCMSGGGKGERTMVGATGSSSEGEFITVTIGGQLVGIPVLSARDVLSPQPIVRIPLAPPQIAGSLNLRGRIVTAIDVRICLGLPAVEDPSASMGVVTEHRGELYSLLVDAVGEVLRLSAETFERNPMTLKSAWRELADGIHRLDGQLLVVLSVERVLRSLTPAAAAGAPGHGSRAMKSCLVVDDSRVVRVVALRIVGALRVEGADAGDGREALERWREHMPDAILLDWNMPVMNGIEFLRTLRAAEGGAAPVVVFCTTERDLKHIRE